MKQNLLTYINKLQAYRTAIKNLHWSSNSLSEHKLLDDIDTSVSETLDNVAEIAQGIFGQIKINELKPRRYKITNSQKMLDDLLKDTMLFYVSTRSKTMIGIRSELEAFIGELNKFKYLLKLALKEDICRKIKSTINENVNHPKRNKILTENQLRFAIREAFNNVLNDEEDETYNISPRWIKKFDNFNTELNNFYQYSGEDCIYEDAYTTRCVKNFKLDKNGLLTYEEDGKIYREQMRYDEEVQDWLNFFKRCLNKAKKYYNMNSETLDAIHDGQINDID